MVGRCVWQGLSGMDFLRCLTLRIRRVVCYYGFYFRFVLSYVNELQ